MTQSARITQMRRLLTARHGQDPRYCTICRCQRPREGGREIAFNGGLRARWICGKHMEETNKC